MEQIIKHDQELMKKSNRKLILNLIREKRPISRADIAKVVNMSPTSVSRIVTELSDKGIVKETQLTSSGVGRKAILLDTVSDYKYTVSVELDKQAYMIGLVDFDSRIIDKVSLPYKEDPKDWKSLVSNVCESIKKMIVSHNIDESKLIGVGIGVPGIIDASKGLVLFSPQLGWKNVELKKYIEKCIGYKATIDNLIKLKALAENIHGSMKGSMRAALVNFGSGVGSALVVNKEIYRGVTNSAGEIGHTTVDPNGRLCDCGRKGCLQTYITEGALIGEANTFAKVKAVEEIFSAANRDEEWATNIIEKLYTYITIAVCNAINMYNPDIIIICGKIIEIEPKIFKEIKIRVENNVWEPFKDTYIMKTSNLGNDAVILGAATSVLDKYIDSL